MAGKLYVVATPLGNLGDISQRALEVLNTVDKIIAEDTRHSQRLLQHYGIQKTLWALHAHNEQEQSEALLLQLEQGMQLALISDAGTPLISDPGYRLVQLAQQHGIAVSPIPGPCAFVAALSALGLPCQEFTFAGFLPAKSSQRQQALRQWMNEPRTLVFYEAPHRIVAALQDCVAVLGADRQAGIARELTKTFETLHVDTLAKLVDWVTNDPNQQLGEIVLVIGGAIATDSTATEEEKNIQAILKILLAELPLKQATSLCAQILNQPKNKVYQLALGLQKGDIISPED